MLLVAAYAGPAATAQQTSGPVTIATDMRIETLSPDESWGLVEYGMAELLTRPEPGGTVTEWMAQSVTPSDDLKTWTITLRPGITFHNGSAVDGEAVAAALRRTIAERQRYLTDATVEATGDLEVTLQLQQANSDVPATLASRYNFPIYDVAALPEDLADAAAVAAVGIYTGPFIPEALTTQGLSARANPDYWQGDVATGGVELRFVDDPQARVAAVESGEADIALSAPAEAALSIGEGGEVAFVTSDRSPSARILLPHVTTPPMDDPRVRRAIGYAIDYRMLAEDVLGGTYEPATGLYDPSIDYGKANYVTDPDAATALLDETGWRLQGDVRVKDGQPLALVYMFEQNDPDARDIGIGLQPMLAEVGIALELRAVESFYAPEAFPEVWHLASRPAHPHGINNSPVDGISYLLGSANAIGEVDDPDIRAFKAAYTATADPAEHARLLDELQDLVWDRGLAFALGFEYPKAVTSREWATFEPTYDAPVIWFDLAAS